MHMEQFAKIEGWFQRLNQRFDETQLQIENRYTALLNVCNNIRKEIENLKHDFSQ